MPEILETFFGEDLKPIPGPSIFYVLLDGAAGNPSSDPRIAFAENAVAAAADFLAALNSFTALTFEDLTIEILSGDVAVTFDSNHDVLGVAGAGGGLLNGGVEITGTLKNSPTAFDAIRSAPELNRYATQHSIAAVPPSERYYSSGWSPDPGLESYDAVHIALDSFVNAVGFFATDMFDSLNTTTGLPATFDLIVSSSLSGENASLALTGTTGPPAAFSMRFFGGVTDFLFDTIRIRTASGPTAGDFVGFDSFVIGLAAEPEDEFEEIPIRFEAVSPAIHADRQWMFMDLLQINFEHGLGLRAGAGSDPQAMLRWSDDGGRNWSNEHWRPIGQRGMRLTRSIWRSLGRFQQRIFHLVCMGPARPKVLQALSRGRVTPR
jgi:hypothetical protein